MPPSSSFTPVRSIKSRLRLTGTNARRAKLARPHQTSPQKISSPAVLCCKAKHLKKTTAVKPPATLRILPPSIVSIANRKSQPANLTTIAHSRAALLSIIFLSQPPLHAALGTAHLQRCSHTSRASQLLAALSAAPSCAALTIARTLQSPRCASHTAHSPSMRRSLIFLHTASCPLSSANPYLIHTPTLHASIPHQSLHSHRITLLSRFSIFCNHPHPPTPQLASTPHHSNLLHPLI